MTIIILKSNIRNFYKSSNGLLIFSDLFTLQKLLVDIKSDLTPAPLLKGEGFAVG